MSLTLKQWKGVKQLSKLKGKPAGPHSCRDQLTANVGLCTAALIHVYNAHLFSPAFSFLDPAA